MTTYRSSLEATGPWAFVVSQHVSLEDQDPRGQKLPATERPMT